MAEPLCESSFVGDIDTSAPFESVREAATRFGGFGFWKPSSLSNILEPSQNDVDEANIVASELEKELISKEGEALKVLKSLETTKAIVEELKSKLHRREDKENCDVNVLKELNQAKTNLCKTTEDLAAIRESVELLNKRLEEERAALEKTRERLNSAEISKEIEFFLYFWAINPNNMMFPGSSKINQPSTRFDEEEKQKDEYLRPLYEFRRRANESDVYVHGPITNFHQLIRSSENNQPSLSITRFDEENERNDGFDIEGIRGSGLMPFSCQGLSTFIYPYRPLVKRYAKLGLHRYNIKKGTNFELDALIKFNMKSNGACSFLITLAARDTVAGRPMQIFQVRVDENRYGLLDATCTTARIKGETTDGFCLPQPVYGFPGWPSDDVVFDASERFCSVEISKLRSNPWIRLYLELAVYTKDRRISDEDLSKLEIVKVVIETTYDEPPLKAKSSDLYIVFKGLARNGLGEQLERKAIIKSVFDEQTGSLSLMGDLCKSQDDVTFMSVEEMHYRFRQSLGAV